MPFVEPAGAHIRAVHVDLQQLAAAASRELLCRLQEYRPDSLATPFRHDIEFVQQRHRPVVPDIGAQREHGEPDGRIVREDRHHVALAKESLQSALEDPIPGVAVRNSRLESSSNRATEAASATSAMRTWLATWPPVGAEQQGRVLSASERRRRSVVPRRVSLGREPTLAFPSKCHFI